MLRRGGGGGVNVCLAYSPQSIDQTRSLEETDVYGSTVGSSSGLSTLLVKELEEGKQGVQILLLSSGHDIEL